MVCCECATMQMTDSEILSLASKNETSDWELINILYGKTEVQRNRVPANVFQGVFSLQVLDVLSNCRLGTVLLGQMLLEPLDHRLVVIPEISLKGAKRAHHNC